MAYDQPSLSTLPDVSTSHVPSHSHPVGSDRHIEKFGSKVCSRLALMQCPKMQPSWVCGVYLTWLKGNRWKLGGIA